MLLINHFTSSSFRQGLKPSFYNARSGAAKAAPFKSIYEIDSQSSSRESAWKGDEG
jgi:hypothetical protein